jgi:hypothetical protein
MHALNFVKNSFMLFICLFSPISMAFHCPSYQDFYQDTQGQWHLTQFPPTPDCTYWGVVHQGPWGAKEHKIDSVNVSLTYGTYPMRVQCSYGVRGSIFMGIDLHTQAKQKPASLPGAPFDGDIPNECVASPEACEFTVK